MGRSNGGWPGGRVRVPVEQEGISKEAGLHRMSKVGRDFCLEQVEVGPASPLGVREG